MLLREACAEPERPSVLPSRIGTVGEGQGQRSESDWAAHRRAEQIHLARFRLAQRGIDWRQWARAAPPGPGSTVRANQRPFGAQPSPLAHPPIAQPHAGVGQPRGSPEAGSSPLPGTSAAWNEGLRVAAAAREQAAPAHDKEGRRALLSCLLAADTAGRGGDPGGGTRAVDLADAVRGEAPGWRRARWGHSC